MLFIWGCQNAPKQAVETSPIQQEQTLLNSIEDHRQYLEKLFEEDQRLRQGQASKVLEQFGARSKEYITFNKELYEIDINNLEKVEHYLAKFGHPKVAEVGQTAADVPCTIIHHIFDFTARERNFGTLYLAYLEGDIDESLFILYLSRTYTVKFNKRMDMENGKPYKAEEEIKLLIQKLGWDRRRMQIESTYKKKKQRMKRMDGIEDKE